MPPAVPLNVYPAAEQFIDVGRETAGFGTLSTALTSVPVAGWDADNKPTWLEDTGLRGSMVKMYDLNQGPIWSENSIPESPLFGDTFPIFLFSLLGDLVTTGTAASPNSTLTSSAAAGATTLNVTSGTGFAANQYIQVDTATTAEVVQIASVATNVITLTASTPLRFNHASAAAVTNTTAPYTHTMALLNSNSSSGNLSAQPPSMSVIHRSGVAGSGGHYADTFLYNVMSEIKITAKASGWMVWEGKCTSYAQTATATTPTAGFSAVRAIPSWRSTTTVASSALNNITDWSCTLTREMDIIATADGTQQPYLFGRGPLSTAFTMTIDPALDETQLTHMLSNDQPTLAWAVSNGLTGGNQVSMAVAAQLAGYKGAQLKAHKDFLGYDVSGEFVPNTTNVGNSGGYGPCVFTFVNAVPTY